MIVLFSGVEVKCDPASGYFPLPMEYAVCIENFDLVKRFKSDRGTTVFTIPDWFLCIMC